jgi:hypothetical protein
MKKEKNPTKCPKFKCNTVSVCFSACRCSSVVFSSKAGREKKKSLETGLWMAICGCGSLAYCCHPAVAGGIIYADLRGELSTHLAPQALFTQSLPVHDATATSFPLSKHTGKGDTAPTFSGLCVYLQLMWKVGLPPSPVEFPPTAAFTSFPTPDCWACAAAPAGWRVCLQLTWELGLPPSPVKFSSLHHSHKLSCSWLLGAHRCSHPLRPGPACLFTVLGWIPLPLSLVLRAPHPLCNVSLLFLLLITQFLFFP